MAKIETIYDRGIIGLTDTVFNKKYLYSIQLKSEKGMVMELKMNYFDIILSNFPELGLSIDDFFHSKKDFWAKRLLTILETRKKVFNEFKFEEKFETFKGLMQINSNFDYKKPTVNNNEKVDNNQNNLRLKQKLILTLDNSKCTFDPKFENKIVKGIIMKNLDKEREKTEKKISNFINKHKEKEVKEPNKDVIGVKKDDNKNSVHQISHRKNNSSYFNFNELKTDRTDFYETCQNDNNHNIPSNKNNQFFQTPQIDQFTTNRFINFEENSNLNHLAANIGSDINHDFPNKNEFKKQILNNMLYRENRTNKNSFDVEQDSAKYLRSKPNPESYIGSNNNKVIPNTKFVNTFYKPKIIDEKSRINNKFNSYSAGKAKSNFSFNFGKLETNRINNSSFPSSNRISVSMHRIRSYSNKIRVKITLIIRIQKKIK